MSATVAQSPLFLAEPEWRARRAAHEERVLEWTGPHQARASRGEKHPVYDFLFDYYAFRPAWLRRWHPGPDVILGGASAREFLRWPQYREVPGRDGSPQPPVPTPDAPIPRDAPHITLDLAALPEKRRAFVTWLRDLLAAMRDRPPFFGCFGLHEWAMVYRQTPAEIRHHTWPLRFPPEEIARIVEASAICCSHFDAFRFFTPSARPLNRLQPTRDEVPRLEQRGCLHANMDLYKWAFKLAPYPPAELLADCFELARDIRAIDMRASPYDVSALGFAPIPIETPAGRADYERHQRAFTARGDTLRERLLALCDRLLAA